MTSPNCRIFSVVVGTVSTVARPRGSRSGTGGHLARCNGRGVVLAGKHRPIVARAEQFFRAGGGRRHPGSTDRAGPRPGIGASRPPYGARRPRSPGLPVACSCRGRIACISRGFVPSPQTAPRFHEPNPLDSPPPALRVLVLDGQYCHALAAVRSLGRRGVAVTVASHNSTPWDSLRAGRSRTSLAPRPTSIVGVHGMVARDPAAPSFRCRPAFEKRPPISCPCAARPCSARRLSDAGTRDLPRRLAQGPDRQAREPAGRTRTDDARAREARGRRGARHVDPVSGRRQGRPQLREPAGRARSGSSAARRNGRAHRSLAARWFDAATVVQQYIEGSGYGFTALVRRGSRSPPSCTAGSASTMSVRGCVSLTGRPAP